MAVDAEHQIKLDTMKQQQRELDSTYRQAIQQLQRELTKSHANQYRMEANISKLLDATVRDSVQATEATQAALSAAAAAKIEAAAAQTEAAASSSRVDELEHHLSDNSLTSIAAKLGVGDRVEGIPSVNQVGARGDVGNRRLSDLAGAYEATMAVVLESTPLGRNDAKGVFKQMRDKRDGALTVMGQALRELREEDSAARDEAVKVLGEAWIQNMKIGDKANARTILSVLVSIRGVKQDEMMKACSYTPALEVGTEVVITDGPNQRTRGR